MALKIQSGDRVVFIGDSITDCGRRGQERPYGAGYVKIFRDMMIAREPEKQVEIINKGIGGNNVMNLRDRWTDDVINQRPDWLSIKVAINDLHQRLRGREEAYSVDDFRTMFDEILSRVTKELPDCKILLIDPFYLSRDTQSTSFRTDVLKTLPEYIDVVHEMSEKYNTRLVKTHEMFQKLLKHHETDTFCPEPVHPNATGHLAIAEAVYEAFSN
jgi:lysophospholipase L1-like esterase